MTATKPKARIVGQRQFLSAGIDDFCEENAPLAAGRAVGLREHFDRTIL